MAVTSTANPSELESLRIARRPERKTRKSYLFFLVSLVVLVALAAAGYAAYQRTLGGPTAVETLMVTSRQADQPAVMLTGSGYVVTRHKYIVIGTKILGQIVEEPIEEGQRVKKGDLLARIDDRDYQAQLRQAIADRDLAQANLQLARSKAARERELYTSGIVSKDEFETYDSAAQVAEAALKRDEAAIDYAKFEVNQCLIVSPIDGVVLQKYRELGDTINYGGQVQAGGGATDIAQLADTGDMRAEVDVNESDIAKVSMGMPAAVVPDAYPQAHFDATLVKIYPEADRQKATVKVEVQIHQPNLAIIKPELSVKANFLEKRAETKNEPRLIIPGKSVQREGSESYVWTVRSGIAKRVSILVGREMVSGIEVKQGLKDGDLVIVAPPANLSDGQTIRATSGATIVR
jgi:HlyD family secretion protein